MAKSMRSSFLFFVSLLLAWFFDFLFWKKPWGISVPIFTMLALAVGLWLARDSGSKPAKKSYWLLAPIILFSFVSIFRQEPFTIFTSRLLVVALSGILALTLMGGHWRQYGFADYALGFLTLLPRGLILFSRSAPKVKSKESSVLRRVALPVLRGLLIGLPLLLFLAALLGSSDPFFAGWLEDIFAFLNIENLFEYFFRGVYIVLLAFVLVAAYSYAALASNREELRGTRKPLLKPFLGFGEGMTILSAVNLLFAAFVLIQFRYFFGGLGQVVDSPAGFTFAEYARRGFGELVVVAVTSLLLFISLSSITERKTGAQKKWFSGLGIALFALVSVILASAYQRLLLYESAYGFTRMRIYPHVFMIWLALLLLAVVVLEAQNRQRGFALAVLVAMIGFAGALALLNVDGFIASANITRAELGYDLDPSYLSTLSDDAVPALVRGHAQLLQQGHQQLANGVAVSLACLYANQHKYAAEIPWQGWNLPRQRAANLMRQFSSEQAFNLAKESDNRWGGWSVEHDAQIYKCQTDLVRD